MLWNFPKTSTLQEGGELFLFFCWPFRSQDLIGNSP